MASGCILGECPVCGDLIYGDEWTIVDDTIVHEGCKEQYMIKKYGMNEQQLQRLCGAQNIAKQIADMEKGIDNEAKYFKRELNVLKKQLEAKTKNGS